MRDIMQTLREAANKGTIMTGKGCASYISPLMLDAAADTIARLEAENGELRARKGKTAIIAITLNGILGDLMDYLDKQGITKLPKSFVQRVDAVSEKVDALGKEYAQAEEQKSGMTAVD